MIDKGQWRCKTTLQKYKEDIAPFREMGQEAEFHKRFRPFEIVEREGNVLLNEGIKAMFTKLCGGSYGPFDNSNARVGVGNGTASAVATQTGLSGGTYEYNAMETGFPSYGGPSQNAVWKASFGDSEANFPWYEWSVDNGTDAINLNRKQESLGTKSSGTWTLTVQVTLS